MDFLSTSVFVFYVCAGTKLKNGITDQKFTATIKQINLTNSQNILTILFIYFTAQIIEIVITILYTYFETFVKLRNNSCKKLPTAFSEIFNSIEIIRRRDQVYSHKFNLEKSGMEKEKYSIKH